jgi:plasmid stabilization system protein ParE
MTAIILEEGEDDLQHGFDYYEGQRRGLGGEMIDEFRQGVQRILEYSDAWQSLDGTYRRYRFPYGIVYRVDRAGNQVVIVAIMHMARRPASWRGR